ncbi:thioredoxin domain-containing protein [Leucobacter sp. W1153]|uniref:DsbA family protein n=1 Tax=Leucobacter sp. W1153 TaxID=3439064 RepID=UPI003F3130BF
MSDAQPPTQQQHPQQPQQPIGQPSPPQWIPVPPPNPHAQSGTGRAGKGLGIASMALGLVALLTAIIATAYFAPAAFFGGFVGLVAVGLGIFALVKKQRPAGTWITGLVAGGIAMLLGLVVGTLGIGTLALQAFSASPGSAAEDQEGPGSGSESGEAEGQSSLIEWPANMATGGIIFGERLEPVASAPLEPGEAPVASEVDRSNGVLDIRVYVDYRCPYCGIFEQTNGPVLSELVDSGAATLELVPLTFLDKASQGSYYSSRASAALTCVVDGQPESAWAAHSTLLAPEVQPTEGGSGHTNEELFQILDRSSGGLNSSVEDCIATERFVPFAQALNNWVFSSSVPNAADPGLRVTATPFVVVNGIPFDGNPNDAAAFTGFLSEIAGY